jgi:peptide/nickel transport system substrate-binding protein
LALVLLGNLSCERAGDPADARGSTVVMAIPDVEVVKPDVWDLDFLVFLPLAKLNDQGELEGRLARTWEHSADHKEYTFHLRADVRWHDGVPVTAHDVKFTHELLSHPDVAEYPRVEATVVDDSTVRIRAAQPDYIDDITYFPRHLLEGLDPSRFMQWDFWKQPVGNGPYRFLRYVPGQIMEFEANSDYYLGKPRIGRVLLKIVGEAGFTELLAGSVDIAEANLTQIPRIASDSRFRVYHSVALSARAIYWRADHPLFSDPRVRRALTLALDRRELRGLLNLPSELPITDGVFTWRQFLNREWPEPLPYDPEQARALLEAAGWVDPDGDGVREKDGHRFRFTASTWQGDGFPQVAVYVQEFLRRVGVQMEIQHLEEATMWDRLRSGDFEAWIAFALTSPHALARHLGRENSKGYNNPEAFGVIDSLQATADPEEVDRLYRRLTEIFRADMPFTRLWSASRTWFVHRRVRGLSTPFKANPDEYMEELWVEGNELESRQR